MNVYLGELYKEVEYIQSDGNQIIDTGVHGTGSTSILTKMIVTGRKGSYDMYYGAYVDGGVVGAFFMQSNYPDNNKIRVINYSNDAATKKYVDSINNLQFNTEYIIEHTNTKFKINGTLQGTMASSSFTTPHTLCVFGVHGKTGNLGPRLIGKVYYFKIYESGNIVRDFVPCYRVSDNVIGLFDKVENKFYTNAGTGTFTKGSDIGTFQSELKNAYIGEYPQLQQIFDFSTSDLHGFTYRTTGGNGLTIDTTNRYCTDNNPGYGCYYKQVNYKKCRQRIKGKLTGGGSLMCGVGNDYAPSSGFSCSLGFDNSKFFVGIKGMSSYSTISSPSGFNGAEWHYYDTIWDNGSVTVKVLNLDESVVVSNTYTATETTQKYIGFCGGTYPNRAMYISEYRLAYEE